MFIAIASPMAVSYFGLSDLFVVGVDSKYSSTGSEVIPSEPEKDLSKPVTIINNVAPPLSDSNPHNGSSWVTPALCLVGGCLVLFTCVAVGFYLGQSSLPSSLPSTDGAEMKLMNVLQSKMEARLDEKFDISLDNGTKETELILSALKKGFDRIEQAISRLSTKGQDLASGGHFFPPLDLVTRASRVDE
jgi:hypothetical protein